MSRSEKEPYDCQGCGWSGHDPKHISWDDRVLHHGDFIDSLPGFGVTSRGPVYGTYYTGSYGSYSSCLECGRRVLSASQREWERKRDKAFGCVTLGVLAIYAILLMLEAVL